MVWRSARTVAFLSILALVVLPSVNTSSHFSAPPGEGLPEQLTWLLGDVSPGTHWEVLLNIFQRDWLTDAVKISEKEGGLSSFFRDVGLLLTCNAFRGRDIDVVRRERKTLQATHGSPWAANAIAHLLQQALDEASKVPEGELDFATLKVEGTPPTKTGAQAFTKALGVVRSLAVHPDSKTPQMVEAPILVEAYIAPGAIQTARQLQDAIRATSAGLWPVRRCLASLSSTDDQKLHWRMLSVSMELTIWFVADACVALGEFTAPLLNRMVTSLDWAAKGQDPAFRGVLVLLPVLLLLYCVVALWIEAIFLVAGMCELCRERWWRGAERKASAGKERKERKKRD